MSEGIARQSYEEPGKRISAFNFLSDRAKHIEVMLRNNINDNIICQCASFDSNQANPNQARDDNNKVDEGIAIGNEQVDEDNHMAKARGSTRITITVIFSNSLWANSEYSNSLK